jgi:hypothetical protein
MIRKTIVGTALAVMLALVPGSAALASGQPGASCGSAGATSSPAGFNTAGFVYAGTQYAGSKGTHSLVSGNAHAVSQYDIACVNVTSAGH